MDMRVNYVSLILLVIFILPVIRGIVYKYDVRYSKSEIRGVEGSIAFLLTLIISNQIIKNYMINSGSLLYKYFSKEMFTFISQKVYIIYFIILPILFYIIQKIILFIFNLINKVTFYPFMNLINKITINKNNGIKALTGVLFQLPRAISNIIITVFILNLITQINLPYNLNEEIQDSKVYLSITERVVRPAIKSNLAKALPGIIDNSFKVQIKDGGTVTPWEDIKSLKDITFNNKQIVYYNGVTLDEAIKSDENIDYTAVSLTEDLDSDRSKARTLYTYVGSNIQYDDAKAGRILNNDFSTGSGAIEAFRSKKGICFDYASLYVAMCIASDLKVRMVTGEGYNGVAWISHAWNEVYLEDEDRWIQVDTTFYKGGNYFNSDRFNLDHRNEQIIGEW
ncbi:MAG: transglutaminase-like domain-containing protein [Clostridiaceae bacterium]